jgi:(p)ppGpp synthase/HD superfamily hydrolase
MPSVVIRFPATRSWVTSALGAAWSSILIPATTFPTSVINRTKVVAVRWDPDVQGEFSVEIRVELENERGIIAKLATAITSKEANIERISTVERDARFSIVNLLLNVKNRIHLARVMKHIRLIKPVAPCCPR